MAVIFRSSFGTGPGFDWEGDVVGLHVECAAQLYRRCTAGDPEPLEPGGRRESKVKALWHDE